MPGAGVWAVWAAPTQAGATHTSVGDVGDAHTGRRRTHVCGRCGRRPHRSMRDNAAASGGRMRRRAVWAVWAVWAPHFQSAPLLHYTVCYNITLITKQYTTPPPTTPTQCRNHRRRLGSNANSATPTHPPTLPPTTPTNAPPSRFRRASTWTPCYPLTKDKENHPPERCLKTMRTAHKRTKVPFLPYLPPQTAPPPPHKFFDLAPQNLLQWLWCLLC